jgi:AAA domain
MSAAPPKASGGRFQRPRRVSDVSQSYFNCILYGPPGAGKTTCAATAPGPILYADCDQGLLALQNPDPALVKQLGINLDEIYFESITSFDDVVSLISKISTECKAQPGWWGTVVLDNLTELQRVLLTDMLRQSERTIPQLQDWNVMLLRMQAIVRSLRNLPVHSVFIAHERQTDQGIGPSLSGRIEEELPGYVDLMARYTILEKPDPNNKDVTKTIRKLRCRAQLGAVPVKAKCRSSRLGDWEEPHIGKIIEKLRSS